VPFLFRGFSVDRRRSLRQIWEEGEWTVLIMTSWRYNESARDLFRVELDLLKVNIQTEKVI